MNKKDTSWEEVADWYDGLLEGGDTYQEKVIAPNLLRLIGNIQGVATLDLACGQGYFTRLLAKGGAEVVGCDASLSLIEVAKKHTPSIKFHVVPSDGVGFAKDNSFDLVVCVLALQNIENIQGTFKEVSRVLRDGGRVILVLNHPVLRIPKRSSWGFDQEADVQYRRLDGYLHPRREQIDMKPGSSEKVYTYSFHRSLQDIVKAASSAGFSISKLEEWISHKKSQPGPRQKAEDTARKEFPLFMALELQKKSGTW